MIKNTCFFLLALFTIQLSIAEIENHSFVMTSIEDASFYMTPTCDGAFATITGDLGGSFAFNPVPADAATIDPITGTITNTISGQTYTVAYTTAGMNPETSFQNVTTNLIVNINDPTPLIICDLDGAQDGLSVFNLMEKDFEILNGLDFVDYSISYYQTQMDAESASNAINSSNYINVIPYFQTIYVRVEDLSTGCNAITTLLLIVEDCTSGCEEDVTICYGNNDSTEYTYTSADGSTMTVFFTSGEMEVCCDWIVVFDADNTLLYEGNNNGNLAGVLVVASGDTITIQIHSNDSGSCETDNYIPIAFTLNCTNTNVAITVNSFFDDNNNTLFDASENLFNAGTFSYEVNNDGVIYNVSAANGSFNISNATVGDSYDIAFNISETYETCLNPTLTLIENIIVTDGETVAVNFPLTRLGDCTDIAVSLVSFTPPRPGQTLTNYLVVENLGNIPVSGSVEFTHDDLVTLNNVSGLNSGNTVTNTSNGFILNFNNLMPGMEEEVLVQLDVPTSLNIGDFITNSVVYSETDLDVSNNSSTLTQAVVNSYDPNDKTESHGPEIKLDDFSNEDYLYYTINFQNLGTAEALEIRVEDMLDSQLDASTFKMLNASHDYTVTRVENALTWQFDDINLPSQSMDEPNSHGYVYFRIKPLPGYSEGDVIPNTADIYFDFNPAITTNTFETEFVANLSVEEFASIGYSMYPNPAKTLVNFEFNKAIGTHVNIQVYDIHGKLVSKSKQAIVDSEISYNISNLPQGLYFIELNNTAVKIVEKLIVN